MLEPRTLHQPEKLKKLSKNDSVFTLSIFRVNEKSRVATICVFNRVQHVHRTVTGFGAEALGFCTLPPNRDEFSRLIFARIDVKRGQLIHFMAVNIYGFPRWARRSARLKNFDPLVHQLFFTLVRTFEFERVRRHGLPFFDARYDVRATKPVGFGEVSR
jgi:hypothetical protein